jgi:hypothetical protein
MTWAGETAEEEETQWGVEGETVVELGVGALG